MGLQYNLVNQTKKERIEFGGHISAGKASELVTYPPAAAIVTWYLLQNPGDLISFVDDHGESWPFPEGTWKDHLHYRDVTEETLSALIDAGHLVEDGREQYFDDPTAFSRILRVGGWRWVPED